MSFLLTWLEIKRYPRLDDRIEFKDGESRGPADLNVDIFKNLRVSRFTFVARRSKLSKSVIPSTIVTALGMSKEYEHSVPRVLMDKARTAIQGCILLENHNLNCGP